MPRAPPPGPRPRRPPSRPRNPTTQPATGPADPSRPGPGHERLKPLVGTFDATIKWRDGPTDEWVVTTGREEGRLILGGRFLQSAWLDRNDGDPIFGLTLIGFDPEDQTYTCVDLDDSDTTISTMTGTASKDGKTLTFATDDGRTVYAVGPDGYGYKVYAKDESGKEYLAVDVSCVKAEK